MGRAEIRRAQRESKKKNKPYNVTRDHVKDPVDMDKITSHATSRAMEIVLSIALITLHDEFGFGEKRLDRFCSHFAGKLDQVNKSNDDSIQKLTKECLTKTGMEVIAEC